MQLFHSYYEDYYCSIRSDTPRLTTKYIDVMMGVNLFLWENMTLPRFSDINPDFRHTI